MDTNWQQLAFDADDHTCYSDNANGTAVSAAHTTEQPEAQYMCLNALDGERDHAPIEPYHAPDRPRRADANVVKFRTFLVEFDKRAIDDQIDFVVEQAKMPYSLMTYSGGKSVHFLICLEEPLLTKAEYKSVVVRLYAALGGKANGLDEQNKNPSRFTRTPNGLRKPGGTLQALLDVRARVPIAELEAWLTEHGFERAAYDERVARAKASSAAIRSLNVGGGKGTLHPSTMNFLMLGAKPGNWNSAFFKATCDMVRCGYSEQEILEKLERAHGHLEPVTVRTVQSAMSIAQADSSKE